jgi:hypothetical protein
MRIRAAVAVCLILAACNRSPADALGAEKPMADRLKAGDPTVCTDHHVQETALLVDQPDTDQRDLVTYWEKEGTFPLFDAVNLVAANRDIGEVVCSANVHFHWPSALAQEHSSAVPVRYTVRPLVGDPKNFVVSLSGSIQLDVLAISSLIKQLKEPQAPAALTTTPDQNASALNIPGTADQLDQAADNISKNSTTNAF